MAVAGCPYPCTRPQFNEIGLMGRVRPDLNIDDCTSCGICVDVCKTGATSMHDGKVTIYYDECNMCGRCIVNCPADARFSAEDGFMMFVGGRGHRNWYYATGLTGRQRDAYSSPPEVKAITREQDLAELKDHAEYLENELKEIRKRIQEIGE